MSLKQKLARIIAASIAASSVAGIASADNTRYDVNGDGYINAKDALFVLRLSLEYDDIGARYDVNDDGYVNAKDALFILRYSLEMTAVDSDKPSQDGLSNSGTGTSSGNTSGTGAGTTSGNTSGSTSGSSSNSTSGTTSGSTSGTGSGNTSGTATYVPHPSAMSSIVSDYTRKWAYNVIPDKLKAAYEALYKGISNGTKSVDISLLNINVNDIATVFWACDADNPQFINVADGCSYTYLGSMAQSIVMSYGRTLSQTNDILKQVADRSVNVIAKAQSLPTVYERVKLFHDWLIENTEYVTEGAAYISETDGPIVNGKGSSVGYAKAFEYLCHSAGIECVCVKGKMNDKSYVWNMVYLDGAWYHIDVAKDDATGTQACFLVSQEQICADRMLNNPFDIPVSPKAYNS